MHGMQNKTIKKVLGEKLEEWLHTIDDIDVSVKMSLSQVVQSSP